MIIEIKFHAVMGIALRPMARFTTHRPGFSYRLREKLSVLNMNYPSWIILHIYKNEKSFRMIREVISTLMLMGLATWLLNGTVRLDLQFSQSRIISYPHTMWLGTLPSYFDITVGITSNQLVRRTQEVTHYKTMFDGTVEDKIGTLFRKKQ